MEVSLLKWNRRESGCEEWRWWWWWKVVGVKMMGVFSPQQSLDRVSFLCQGWSLVWGCLSPKHIIIVNVTLLILPSSYPSSSRRVNLNMSKPTTYIPFYHETWRKINECPTDGSPWAMIIIISFSILGRVHCSCWSYHTCVNWLTLLLVAAIKNGPWCRLLCNILTITIIIAIQRYSNVENKSHLLWDKSCLASSILLFLFP